MNAMHAFFAKFQKDERGVTAIEYGLIAIAMAGVLTVAFSGENNLTGELKKGFTSISGNITTLTTEANQSVSGAH
ncbi:Flp family type IVb pilin [Photobacterium leiognathi]|uniref:Flp family type IVb pilin n=1 Tax=Photobacterium leiognathi TaxID=553611 RepID=UPI0029810BF8|nr:Flp family type IVb pilin [Photobacterium leiognathi]